MMVKYQAGGMAASALLALCLMNVQVRAADAVQGSNAATTVVADEAASELPQITVTATRTATDVDEVPATITVVTRQQLDNRLPADEADLFRDDPDVVMARELRRFGAAHINIRGIEDNRVAQMLDGVRLSDVYDSGGPTNFTLNTPMGVSEEFLKRVEVLRGPASSLYGSDAIGGVVGYITLDPEDVITPGEDYGIRYRLGFNGANNGVTNTILGAWRNDMLDILMGYTRDDASQFQNKGSTDTIAVDRSSPNPQDVTDQGVIAKAILHPSAEHKISLVVEAHNQDVDSDVKRLTATLPKVTATTGDDQGEQRRASIAWEYTPQGRFYDRLTLNLYRQNTDSNNSNLQTRSNTSATCSAAAGAGNNCLVDQSFNFSQTATGGGVQLESATKLMELDNLFTYGVDLSTIETKELRDATSYNLTTGTVSKSLAGDNFPVRDFPTGTTDTLGLFVQDEISHLAGGPLSITPAVRYDWRRLKPDVDALAQVVLAANNRTAVQQIDSHVSPKIAAMWDFNPAVSAYGQVVGGFRAPNYNEVNGSFRNAIQSYAVSPNSDLKPETSVGFEVGTKWHTPTLRGQVSVYDNHYHDFIENVTLTCPADPRCIAGVGTTFINDNISSVRIYGAEVRSSWDFTPGWNVDGALAWAHGENESANQPLNSVEPARLSVGLVREAGDWGAEARARGAAAVTRTDDTGGAWFHPGGYCIASLSAWWRPMKAAQVNIGINNLFDKKYFLWSDIRQADARNPVGVDFYSQPGRTASASFTYQF